MSEPKHKVEVECLDDKIIFDLGQLRIFILKPRYVKGLSDNQISIVANQIYKLAILFKSDPDDEKIDFKFTEQMLRTFFDKYSSGNTTAKHFLKTWLKEDFWFNE
ncbi:hypothetical protein TRFO_36757 [Tritrichomonas foetus]|uniref:Uncharacterized protein n=1 Tax=Tritrichomonas foetus TaxID=1144522 RepID=A0A1J4JFJ9_9EUKA|nr:hypothetical protein TRFO_36757 [Tritrichomonas foetus]|eukprot:OHS97063.1 hypothetical protein TRFO_36757 [Tritrichomonas foetus]